MDATLTLSPDAEIAALQAALAADPENEDAAVRLENALRRAGRDQEADAMAGELPPAMTSGRNARDFVLASNGARPRLTRFTVVHAASGKRITFSSQRERLTTPQGWKAMDQAAKEAFVQAADTDGRHWVIGAMVGSDNVTSYERLGVVKFNEFGAPQFFWAAESKVAVGDLTVRAMAWLWRALAQGVMPAEATFHPESCCGRCGKTLTTPGSIERGLGPICDGKVRAVNETPVQPTIHNSAPVQPNQA